MIILARLLLEASAIGLFLAAMATWLPETMGV